MKCFRDPATAAIGVRVAVICRWTHSLRSKIKTSSIGWLEDGAARVAEPSSARVPGVRFAFYGRTSTAEFQDPATSRAWQREIASALVAGHGTITVEFFDVGCSRRVAWERRPQAAALLERACAADRSFDAVVVGEFERAFTDRQFEHVAGLLARRGIEVWLPEAGGPVRLDDPRHSC